MLARGCPRCGHQAGATRVAVRRRPVCGGGPVVPAGEGGCGPVLRRGMSDVGSRRQRSPRLTPSCLPPCLPPCEGRLGLERTRPLRRRRRGQRPRGRNRRKRGKAVRSDLADLRKEATVAGLQAARHPPGAATTKSRTRPHRRTIFAGSMTVDARRRSHRRPSVEHAPKGSSRLAPPRDPVRAAPPIRPGRGRFTAVSGPSAPMMLHRCYASAPPPCDPSFLGRGAPVGPAGSAPDPPSGGNPQD